MTTINRGIWTLRLKWIAAAAVFQLWALKTTAQDPWKFQKEKDGIRISTRNTPNSSFDDIRVEADFSGTIQQIAKILMDVNHYREWSYATKKSVLIKQNGPGSLIYYSEIECPWPATNRFFYAAFELKENVEEKSLRIVSTNLPDYKPETKDLVKVAFSKGTWYITTIAPGTIHIDYTLQLDPGGTLPAWVLNLFSTKGPMETFQNLKGKLSALNR
jgi:hypothetical protein